MSLHGQNKDALAKTQKGAWRYDVIAPGYKCNMTDIQAAIGLVELGRYEAETIPRRRELYERYNAAFAPYDWARTPVFVDRQTETSYHLYQLRLAEFTEDERDAVIAEIAALDVAVNVHFIPLPMLTAYKNLGYRMNDYPLAYSCYANEISLPLYYDLTFENVDTVVTAVVAAVEKVRRRG
jgi:dTDP-4-amino-4,6-dideoxygalactose transaminase